MGLKDASFAESAEYQQKILSLMLHNPTFCEVAGAALKDEDFSNRILQWYYDKLTDAPIHLTTTTLREELLKASKAKIISEDLVPKYVENFKVLATPPVPFEEDYIRQHMQDFIRAQACKRAALNVGDYIAAGDWDQIQIEMTDAANAGVDIMSLGTDFFSQVQDRIANRIHREAERKLSTGIPELDDMTYGGLKTKQLGLCVGGTGRGKSIFLQWLAKVAILLGKKVVYFTFELSEEDMADRFDAMFARIKPNALKDNSAAALKQLSGYNKKYGSSLFIKEYPEDEATVHDLKAYLLQLSAHGFVPDLVLVDYVDLVKPHRNYNDPTLEQNLVIKALRGMSKSMNTRIWTAAQLNRGGLAMETPDEGSIAGAVGKLFTADIALFMAQTQEEREDQIMRLWVSKNRNGRAGRTIKIDTDYEFMTFMRKPVEESTNDKTTGTAPKPEGDDVPNEDSGDMLILSE